MEGTNRLIDFSWSSQLLTRFRRRKERAKGPIWFLNLILSALLCLSTQCELIKLLSCICDGGEA